MKIVLLIIVCLIALAWLFTRLVLTGEDLRRFDTGNGQRFATGRPESTGLAGAMARLASTNVPRPGLSRQQQIYVKRRLFDSMFDDLVYEARFTPVDNADARGEWVAAPGADPDRRMLYIHGGGMVVGSARSHRPITVRMSALSGGAVLAIDYRLMPEHHRLRSVEDTRQAYRWMLANGPDGAAAATAIFVAGDSAGGNLTLSLLPWIRDQQLRAPNGAIAISPPTDSTLSSPSIPANAGTDYMLGPAFKSIARMPRAALLWLSWLHNGIRPNDPVVSPVFGDLSGLPPVLVHVSETEMLYDDARRYVNRARAAGSPATLQSWDNTLHVWHIFDPELPEAGEAYIEIGKFLAKVAPHQKAPT
ncbi:alpha/beta hydrolase [Massilia sp. Root418]|uniref:alpha/beta hydrolase n=1 Tax=Massilia sp. Root418 TaxID=1736532 RepID=UPI0006FE612B|nr:alpha/beta hydrolase [Massilia sp. Root418]KQW93161.1 alpha/beta hydrolase [Massilia sp. Root418]